MRPFLIIKTGGTFSDYAADHKDFEHWTAQTMGLEDDQWECVDVQSGALLPDPTLFSGCVLTGSHDMVTEKADWMRQTGEWLKQAIVARIPVIGICFGHQLLADLLGGKVEYHPDGIEIGTMKVTTTPAAATDPLFATLPGFFPAHTAHSQSVLQLPKEATLLARSEHEAHHAVRFGDLVWGVQFHPEFDVAAMQMYVACQKEKIADSEERLAAVCATPEAMLVLHHFVALCRELEEV